jgi:hypothetical protein
MCVIVVSPHNEPRVRPEYLENCAENNDDGMGIAYVDNGFIKVYKTMNNLEELIARYDYAREVGSTALMHFRITTHGTTDISNCQPFFVSSDVVFAHNGMIEHLGRIPKGVSDTRHFRDEILAKMSYDWLSQDGARSVISSIIGMSSKLAFLAKDNTYNIIHEGMGEWVEGAWFSNWSYLFSYGNAWCFNKRSDDDINWAASEIEYDKEYGTVIHEIVDEGLVFEGMEVCLGCVPHDLENYDVSTLFKEQGTGDIYCELCGTPINHSNAAAVAVLNQMDYNEQQERYAG